MNIFNGVIFAFLTLLTGCYDVAPLDYSDTGTNISMADTVSDIAMYDTDTDLDTLTEYVDTSDNLCQGTERIQHCAWHPCDDLPDLWRRERCADIWDDMPETCQEGVVSHLTGRSDVDAYVEACGGDVLYLRGLPG